MTEYTHTLNWFCIHVGCPNCPYRRGTWCFEKQIKNGDLND